MSAVTTDQLPILPETKIIEPIVQCGVLYLGSAPPSPGRRGLDSVQEPFSHRYPVDGTNTARGIDSILSIYDNGIQLTFARQPHVVIFFPLSSLIYCASLRFSIVENDQTSLIDWRFITLDSTEQIQSKHPPLFCAVMQRTQILSGDECHCFITKSNDAALTLVRTISEVYANLQANIKPLRSPIFYQLDRYGRKITETSGIIYLSPATNNDESQINPINRQILLDPSLDGFFYRTDTTIIEQWQLWDDDDINGTRPHPPDSPFGQHQGLYHDDLTNEIHEYLRHMDDEEPSSSCSSSSIEYHHRRRSRRRSRSKSKTKHRTDSLNASFSHSHTGSFDPSLSFAIQNNREIKKPPIIIEKIVPNPMITNYGNCILEQSQQSFPLQQTNNDDDYNSLFSDTYQINQHGEKITQDGNRIVFMDVIQPNIINNNNNNTELQSYKPPKLHRKRSKHIPVLDLRSIESLLKNSKQQQRIINDDHLSTSDMLEIVEGYFEDYKGRKLQLNGDDAQTMIEHFDASSHIKYRHRNKSNDRKHHRHRSHSILTSGPGINYVERPSIESQQQQQPISTTLNTEQVNQYVSNIYGTTKTSPSNNMNKFTSVTNPDYISPFRYMQSSINPLLLREYRNVFNGIK